MGYVYTPQEFEDGMIADADGFRRAASMLTQGTGRYKGLKELSERGVIAGAVINGSNLHGDGGAGSDLDVFVVTASEDAGSELRQRELPPAFAVSFLLRRVRLHSPQALHPPVPEVTLLQTLSVLHATGIIVAKNF